MSGRELAAVYSDEFLQEGQMRLWRPADWNRLKHIRQMRSAYAGAGLSMLWALSWLSARWRAAARAASAPLDSRGLCCPGLRPGAERLGKPRRAARVMMAGMERPSASEISCGEHLRIHIARSVSSCSGQLGPGVAKPAPDSDATEGSVCGFVPLFSVRSSVVLTPCDPVSAVKWRVDLCVGTPSAAQALPAMRLPSPFFAQGERFCPYTFLPVSIGPRAGYFFAQGDCCLRVS